jgi:hypothetical protein
MRWHTNYGNCLTFGADFSGFYLSILFLFRLWHPPLFLPWQEVSVRRRFKVLFFFRYVELRLGREEQIPITIGEDLAGRLRAAAGANWPIEAIF